MAGAATAAAVRAAARVEEVTEVALAVVRAEVVTAEVQAVVMEAVMVAAGTAEVVRCLVGRIRRRAWRGETVSM